MDQFHIGLCNDIKDLLLTLNEDHKSPIEVINQAIQCDNRIFELRLDRLPLVHGNWSQI